MSPDYPNARDCEHGRHRGHCEICDLIEVISAEREARERAERERDRYHDALVARHGGEPVALLEELDVARRERDEALSSLEERGWQLCTAQDERDVLRRRVAERDERIAAWCEIVEAAGGVLEAVYQVERGQISALVVPDGPFKELVAAYLRAVNVQLRAARERGVL